MIKEQIPITIDSFTHLYTLIVRPDNTFEVKIDQESRRNGSLVDDFDMLKPKMIDDPNSKKPNDWVDEAEIPDPTDKKPDDWDQPETIEDPNAKKPEDWNDEMDGEWSAPKIPNPDYKGPWHPKMIPNPKYKGEWKPERIPNPEFVDDPNLYARTMAFIGLDLWQVKSGTLFDNFIVTDDVSECEAHAKYWKPRFDGEKKDEKKPEMPPFMKTVGSLKYLLIFSLFLNSQPTWEMQSKRRRMRKQKRWIQKRKRFVLLLRLFIHFTLFLFQTKEDTHEEL